MDAEYIRLIKIEINSIAFIAYNDEYKDNK